MGIKKKVASPEQAEATNLAYQLRALVSTDDKLTAMIGISKVTLYTRLRLSNWKKPEIAQIEKLIREEGEK